MANDYSNLINQAYQSIGLQQGDQPGVEYWSSQLQSGALTPENFQQNFLTAASGVTDPQYASNVAQAQSLLSNLSQPSSVTTGSTAPSPLGPNISFSTQPTYGTAGDVSAYDIDQFIGANINDPQAIRDAMARTGITQQDLEKMYAGTQYTPETIGNYLALPDTVGTVKDIYEKIGFTNPEDPNYQAGIDYWAGRLRAGDITPETFEKEFLTAASGITDPNYATYVSNAQNLINQYTGLMSLINADVSDPVKLIQQLESQGVTPEQVLAAQQYASGANAPTLDAIKQYWEQGRGGFEDRFQQIAQDVFGSEANQQDLANLLSASKTFNPEGLTLESVLNPEEYSSKSLDDIQKALQNSYQNKLQDAATVASLASNMFGITGQERSNLVSDLISGNSENELANKVYQELLTQNRLSPDTQTELLLEAARTSPDAPIFKNNPSLYTRYKPLGEATEKFQEAGQYDYYNNAPILNASEVEKVMDGKDIALDFRSGRTDDNAMGWDLNSRDAGSIRRGAAVFGVTTDQNQIKRLDELEQKLADLGQIKQVSDGEGGTLYVSEQVRTDDEGNRYTTQVAVPGYEEYLDEKTKLDKAAAQVGLNPDDYESFADLQEALQDKTKDIYRVTGRTSGWSPEVAAATGIQTLTSAAGDMNHASVLYRKEGDRLIAIQPPTIFTANDKKRSGFAAQMADYAMPLAILTLPAGGVGGALFGAGSTAAGLANLAYATAMSGGDFGDFAKAAVLQQVAAPIADKLSEGLGSLDLGLSADAIKRLSEAGAGAITTAIGGGDLESFLINQGIGNALDLTLSELGIDSSTLTATERIAVQALLPSLIKGEVNEKTMLSMASKIGNEMNKQAKEQAKLNAKSETPK